MEHSSKLSDHLVFCSSVLVVICLGAVIAVITLLSLGCEYGCVNGMCQYTICKCQERFSGIRCEIGYPLNEGIWNVSTNRADCPVGFCGELCEILRPFRGGQWDEMVRQTKCPQRFHGILCGIGHPLNNGTWIKRLSSSQCPDRFSGTLCEFGHPFHDGKWNMESDQAECPPRFFGQLCEIGVPYHQGKWNAQNRRGDCPPGFGGILCELGHPLNGGVWNTKQGKSKCPQNFNGSMCEIGNPHNKGVWDVNRNKADCPREWGGQLCDTKIDCPQGIFTVGKTVLWFSYAKATWKDANVLCESQHSQLLVMEETEELESLVSFFKKDFQCKREFWVFSTAKTKGKFVWKNTDKPFNLNKWCLGQPSGEDCVAFNTDPNHCFQDEYCEQRFHFICQIVSTSEDF